MQILIIIAVVGLVIGGIIYAAIAAKKRREAFALLATQLGLSYSSDHNQAMAQRYGFLDKLANGSNRYAYNILSGRFQDREVEAFDYHYETHSTDSKGRRQTHHHHFSAFVLTLERSFPELIIAPEGFFSKIAQAFGYDDIDFESHEFSRKFVVRSKDKKFAYDVCNALMMEHLLANPDLNIEIDSDALCITCSGCLKPEQIEDHLRQLVEIRALLPDYLFSNR